MTSNTFSDDGKIVIDMPKLIRLDDAGSTIQVSPINRSIKATFGKVIDGNKIEINNVFGRSSKKSQARNIKIEFFIKSAYNQDTAIDAGGLKITTYTQIDAKFYVVD